MTKVRDITCPDGTVRHNVGSDNLSDEDRISMDQDLLDWIEAGSPGLEAQPANVPIPVDGSGVTGAS